LGKLENVRKFAKNILFANKNPKIWINVNISKLMEYNYLNLLKNCIIHPFV